MSTCVGTTELQLQLSLETFGLFILYARLLVPDVREERGIYMQLTLLSITTQTQRLKIVPLHLF